MTTVEAHAAAASTPPQADEDRAIAVVAHGVTKTYGHTRACDRIDLHVQEGSVHALLGENGAGKSSFVKMLFGLTSPDDGTLEVWGEQVAFRTPADALRAGIGMVQQHFSLAPSLTAEENLALAGSLRHRIDRAAVRTRAADIEQATGLAVTYGVPVGELSVGEQQRIEILRALLTGARLLILDEPTAVLSASEAATLLAGVRRLATAGTTVLLITHRMDDVFAGSDHVTVLRLGRAVLDAPTSTLTHADLVHAITGDRFTPYERRELPPPDHNAASALEIDALRVEGWKGAAAVDDLTLAVAAGEIVGVAGVEGNGQRQLCEALVGQRSVRRGEVRMDGRSIVALSTRKRLGRGLLYVPDDRHAEGLLLSLTSRENYFPAVTKEPGVRRARFGISWKRVNELFRVAAERFDIRPPHGDAVVGQLSGGNQQKVVLARALAPRPRCVLASQPTRGVDLGAAEDLRTALVEAARGGAGVLLLSADLEELYAVCHRIVVLARGRITWGGPADPERRHEVLAAMTGGVVDERNAGDVAA